MSLAQNKPQKQALAIAYAVKKRMQKKAHGGTIEGSISPEEQAHGQTPQPMQPVRQYQPSRGVNPIRPEPTIGQAKFGPAAESEHFAVGGQVKDAMSRRERALLAARGGGAEKYPGAASSENEPAQGKGQQPSHQPMVSETPQHMSAEEQSMFAKGGAVGMADYHRRRASLYDNMAAGGMADPMNQAPALKEHDDEHEKETPATTGAGAMQSGMKDFIKGAGKGMKKFSHGGYADPELSDEEQNAFYDRGGIARSGEGGNQISSPRAPYKPLSPGFGKYPLALKEEEGERFALGGEATGGAIAKRIREQKRMAFGGKAHEDDDRPEDGDSIDNFERADHPDNDFLSDEEQTDYHHLNAGDLDEEEEKPKRKGMLDRIMRGIHSRNGNP